MHILIAHGTFDSLLNMGLFPNLKGLWGLFQKSTISGSFIELKMFAIVRLFFFSKRINFVI